MEDVAGAPQEVGEIARDGTDLLAKDGTGVFNLRNTGAALPPATQVGEVLYSVDGATFTVALPITGDGGWLVNDSGIDIVYG